MKSDEKAKKAPSTVQNEDQDTDDEDEYEYIEVRILRSSTSAVQRELGATL